MIRLGKVRIEVVREDLTAQHVDVVVCPANTYLWMKHGVAGMLKREGGDDIEREAMGKGPIPLGEVVFTRAGSLPCRRIAHVAIMGQDLRVSPEAIRRGVVNVLLASDETRAAAVAFPPMTGGSNAPSLEAVAAGMCEPMIDLLPDARHLRSVRVCVQDQEELERFRSVLLGFFRG